MSQSKLKLMAEELEKTLAAIPPSPKRLATTPETPKLAKTLAATASTQTVDGSLAPTEDLNPLIRAIVEYSMGQSANSRTPNQIGEAIGVGITIASKELSLSESKLVEALDVYLREVVKSAKNTAR